MQTAEIIREAGTPTQTNTHTVKRQAVENSVSLTRARIRFGSVRPLHKQGHRIHMGSPPLPRTRHRGSRRAPQHRHSPIHISWVSGTGRQSKMKRNVRCVLSCV